MARVERTKRRVEGEEQSEVKGGEEVMQTHVGECKNVDSRQRNIRPLLEKKLCDLIALWIMDYQV